MAEKALFRIALDKAMDQCSRREFCCDDIRNKLSQWGVENNDADKIIKNLIKENNLDDKIYQAGYILHRISSAKTSLLSAEEYDAFITEG